MQRKAEIQKAYKECVNYMQTLDILSSETNLKSKDEVGRCAGWQECLLWVLTNDKNTYRTFNVREYITKDIKKEEENEFDRL